MTDQMFTQSSIGKAVTATLALQSLAPEDLMDVLESHIEFREGLPADRLRKLHALLERKIPK